MADGTWISNLKADLPLNEAAETAFAARSKAIRKFLPLALEHSSDNVEYIHQLRVGTRRAGAVVSEFKEYWPEKLHLRLEKSLKRLRRAAGAARDWDVMKEALQERRGSVSETEWPGIDYLLAYAQGERETAQRNLEQVSRKVSIAELNDLWNEAESFAKQPRKNSKLRTLRDLASIRIPEHFQLLHELASGDLSDYEHLHQVRIQGKRLRYAMELFVDCFKPPFKKDLYPVIEEMQEILGQANDSHVALDRLGAACRQLQKAGGVKWRKAQPGCDALLAFHEERLLAQQTAFIRWWQNWQLLDAGHRIESLLKKP